MGKPHPCHLGHSHCTQEAARGMNQGQGVLIQLPLVALTPTPRPLSIITISPLCGRDRQPSRAASLTLLWETPWMPPGARDPVGQAQCETWWMFGVLGVSQGESTEPGPEPEPQGPGWWLCHRRVLRELCWGFQGSPFQARGPWEGRRVAAGGPAWWVSELRLWGSLVLTTAEPTGLSPSPAQPPGNGAT